MALLQYLDKFDPNKLVVNRPTITSLEKVSRRIERQAEGLDEKDIEPSTDILEEVVSQLRNKNELSKKSLKLMAAGGLDYFKSLPDGDFLLQRFLTNLRQQKKRAKLSNTEDPFPASDLPRKWAWTCIALLLRRGLAMCSICLKG